MSDNDMSDEEQMSAGDTNPEGGIGPQGVFDVDKIRQLTELMSESRNASVGSMRNPSIVEHRNLLMSKGLGSAPAMRAIISS